MNSVKCLVCKEIKRVIRISNRDERRRGKILFRKSIHTLECNHKYIEEKRETYDEAVKLRRKIREKGERCTYIHRDDAFDYYWFGHTGIPA